MAMNEAMRLEREAFLNAGAYERTEGRLGYANGFKPKTLDEEIRLFKERPLGCYSVLYVDAEYQRVRMNGSVVDAAVLQAIGINAAGKREVVRMSVSTSEAEVHWRTFFTSLVNRGMHGVTLIVSGDHPGMKAARKAVFPAVPWQRCYFHLCQNAQAYALMALRGAVQYWSETKKHKSFADWLESNAEESMTYFDFNEGWCRLPESRIVREAYRLATDGTTRGMDGRKSLLNREGNGKICFLCMNLQKRTCLIKIYLRSIRQLGTPTPSISSKMRHAPHQKLSIKLA